MVTSGLVGWRGRLVGPGGYIGEDFLLREGCVPTGALSCGARVLHFHASKHRAPTPSPRIALLRGPLRSAAVAPQVNMLSPRFPCVLLLPPTPLLGNVQVRSCVRRHVPGLPGRLCLGPL